MAHLVETMMYCGATPWHGLGVAVPDAQTSAEAIVAAGLDWKVGKEPLFLSAYPGSFALGAKAPETYAVVRNTDRSILGVVGEQYTPLQNTEAFNFFDAIVESKAAVFHTAGSLSKGRRIWLLAKLPDTIKVKGNDIVDQYLLLSNSHDGSSAVQIKFTPIRVVCNNTLSAAMRDGHQVFHVRHTRSVKDKVVAVKDMLGIIQETAKVTALAYQNLARISVNPALMDKYLLSVIPDNPSTDNNTRTLNIRNRVVNLFENDWRNNLPETRGTLWAAYNAVTHYVDHERGSDKNRLESAWFGSGDLLKTTAFHEALKLAA